jgi:hypothetical protein
MATVPGISVTVYLPPYLVGLKMSDCTVAMAFEPAVSKRCTNYMASRPRAVQLEEQSLHLIVMEGPARHDDVALARRRT